MKKLTLLLLALLALTLTGCGKPTQEQVDDIYSRDLVTVNYKGHSYILYKAHKQGGITHDPDCPCHNNHVKLD